MTIVLDNYLRVPKDTAVNWDVIRGDLWVENLATAQKRALGWKLTKSDYPGMDMLGEDDTHYLLPRNYLVNLPVTVPPPIPHHVPVEMPKFRLKLWKAQKAAARSLTDRIGEDKILSLGCGKGKTILSLWYAAQLKQRTLIIVDRDFLLDQWVRRIKTCFLMPRKRIGVVQGKKNRIGGEFTIAMVHTLSKRDYPVEWYDQFGLVIVDECHVMAAPTFAPVLPRCRGERLGLSATPNRKDGMSAVFERHLGPICYQDYSRDRQAMWVFSRLPAMLGDRETAQCFKYAGKRRDGSVRMLLNRPIYDTKVATNELWNTRIASEISRAVAAGRYVLCLGTRVEQLRILDEKLFEYGIDAGYVDSGVKGRGRLKAFRKQVLLATQGLASRALDIPQLDTLMLLYPSSDEGLIRQAVGRLDRKTGLNPIVVTFSHYAVEGMDRKEESMRDIIEEIDPGAPVQITGTY